MRTHIINIIREIVAEQLQDLSVIKTVRTAL